MQTMAKKQPSFPGIPPTTASKVMRSPEAVPDEGMLGISGDGDTDRGQDSPYMQ